jgi:hypothetical protein
MSRVAIRKLWSGGGGGGEVEAEESGASISPAMQQRARCVGCERTLAEVRRGERWYWYVAKQGHLCARCDESVR